MFSISALSLGPAACIGLSQPRFYKGPMGTEFSILAEGKSTFKKNSTPPSSQEQHPALLFQGPAAKYRDTQQPLAAGNKNRNSRD